MNVYETILKRRSIRKYNDDLITDEIITNILKAAMAAPSARNTQPWLFYVIKNKKVLKELNSIFKDFNAPVMIVVAGDVSNIENTKSGFWIQDCSAATQNILLASEGYNIGTCWCGIYPKEEATKKVKEILNLEENIIPLSLIQLGYKAEEKESRTQYDESKIKIID